MSGMDQDKCSNCSVSEVFDSDYLLFFDTIAVSSLGGQQYDPRNVTNRDGAIIDLSVSSTNKNLDIVFWSCFVLIVTLLLQLFNCCFYCCLCYTCKGPTDSPNTNTKRCFKLLALVCGLFTAAFIAVATINTSFLIYFESELEHDTRSHASNTTTDYQSLISRITQSPEDTDLLEGYANIFIQFQANRFYVSVTFLTLILLVLIFIALAVCCAPVYNSTTGVIITISFNIMFVLTGSLLAGTTFGELLYLSNLCLDLYCVGGMVWCRRVKSQSEQIATNSLRELCGDQVYNQLFLVTILYWSLLLSMLLLQLLSAMYAGTITLVRGRTRRDESTLLRQRRRRNKARSVPIYIQPLAVENANSESPSYREQRSLTISLVSLNSVGQTDHLNTDTRFREDTNPTCPNQRVRPAPPDSSVRDISGNNSPTVSADLSFEYSHYS